MTYTKADIARRQLGTALALYLERRDPISVHCLACGGCEIAEHLAEQGNQKTLRTFSLASNPSMDARGFVNVRNQYWNAFKHASGRGGAPRDDSALLGSFTERENEERLFIGWFDYAAAVSCTPIEAQVFMTWFLALDLSRFAADVDPQFLANLDSIFPGLRELSLEKQRIRLTKNVSKAKKDKKLLGDPSVDLRPLILL